ncbi:hypothetical protein GGI07_000653 [Coemansia sp. Benny D115]|nr:hypothetical protein GGI07_000653 [Coemansia sp. Benny D115]
MEEEGPAFISFSGLPDENIYDFVDNVDALRKHFKWSSQVTFCYARTMLKGSARKIIQATNSSSKAATDSQSKAVKNLGDEAIDPNSWNNLRSALVFEFSDQYRGDRLLVQLLGARQQTGESGSEYAQRFVTLVHDLVGLHPLDSSLLAVLFANGLRSERLRWELLMRRLGTLDRAVGYVAPEQLYRVAKLAPLLSPASMAPPPVGSPRSEGSATESGSPTAFALSASSDNFVDEADAISAREIYGPDVLAPGATAKGATFSLDDDGDDGDDEPTGSGYWTPPNLPSVQQRRLHRQSTSALPRPRQATAPAVSMLARAQELYEPRRLGRTPSIVSMDSNAGSAGDTDEPRSAVELNSLAEQLESLSLMLREKSEERRRRPRLCYRCRQKGHVASECPLPADAAVPGQQRSAAPVAVSTVLAKASTPSQPQTMGHQQQQQQQQSPRGNNGRRKPLMRSHTVSASSESLPWRASSVAVYNAIVENSRAGMQTPRSPANGRSFTQPIGWSSGGNRHYVPKQQ